VRITLGDYHEAGLSFTRQAARPRVERMSSSSHHGDKAMSVGQGTKWVICLRVRATGIVCHYRLTLLVTYVLR
jgi:hypothetical protein